MIVQDMNNSGHVAIGRRCALTTQLAALFLYLAVSGPASAEVPVDYLTQVKPVLAERCYACHGALKQEGDLRLDTAAFAIKGGMSGPAVEPGNAAASLLWQRITAVDEAERMP